MSKDYSSLGKDLLPSVGAKFELTFREMLVEACNFYTKKMIESGRLSVPKIVNSDSISLRIVTKDRKPIINGIKLHAGLSDFAQIISWHRGYVTAYFSDLALDDAAMRYGIEPDINKGRIEYGNLVMDYSIIGETHNIVTASIERKKRNVYSPVLLEQTSLAESDLELIADADLIRISNTSYLGDDPNKPHLNELSEIRSDSNGYSMRYLAQAVNDQALPVNLLKRVEALIEMIGIKIKSDVSLGNEVWEL